VIPGLTADQATAVLSVFAPESANGRLREIILFGSRAKGTHREGSDIDLAVAIDRGRAEDLHAWMERYEALFLPWKLDVVLYDSIENDALREHIDRVGIKLKLRD